jgi:hypothetical protein
MLYFSAKIQTQAFLAGLELKLILKFPVNPGDGFIVKPPSRIPDSHRLADGPGYLGKRTGSMPGCF